MNRREVLAGIAALLPAGPVPAQPRAGQARVALLRATSMQDRDLAAFRDGLRDLGLSVSIEARYAQGVFSKLPELAAELARWRPDVVVVDGDATAKVMREVTAAQPMPIVFVVVTDPVKLGFAASLARPGGALTGLSSLAADLVHKRVALLREALPDVSRLGILIQGGATAAEQRAQVRAALQASGVMGLEYEVNDPAELDGALRALDAGDSQAALTLYSPLFCSERRRIMARLTAARRPAIHPEREFVEDGGLFSYGIDFKAQWRRAASFVGRILGGASPGALPIEQPTRFELVANLRTARALGVSVTPAFLAQVDEVIE